MTPVNSVNGERLLVQIGDGATPTETFAASCLINTERGIQFTSSTNDAVIPDCENPENPAFVERIKDHPTAAINGAGMLHTSSVDEWFAWYLSQDTNNVRVKVDVSAANGGGYWEGAFLLTDFEVTGTRKEKATASITLQSSGAFRWVKAE